MAEEGGSEVTKKKDTEEEERRLRERLKRRKEDRHQDEQRRRRNHARGPPIRGPPPPGYYDHRRGPPNRHWRGPPGPGPREWRGGPPMGRRSHSPRSYGGGRARPPQRHDGRMSRRSHSYSRSRSRSRGRSRSRSSSGSSRSYSSSDDESRSRSRSSDNSRSSRSRSASASSSSSSSAPDHHEDPDAYALTKDQRTVFVSQLVMRANERDVRRYFRRTIGVKVNAVAMLRDKRTGRHKGFCYVELARLEDVVKAVVKNNQKPDFQRFPILIKPSEAEKNYTVPSANTVTASMMGMKSTGNGPVVGPNGKLVEAQKAYVGNLDPNVTQEHIFSLFSPFGQLEKVMLQTDPTTGVSKGFAFLSYRDAKDANLAIQTMAGQTVAGRQLKTGWANQTSTVPSVEVVTSYEFPDDAPTRIQNAHLALAQLAGSGLTNVAPLVPPTDITATAEAALNAALGLPVTPTGAAGAVAPQVPAAAAAAALPTDSSPQETTQHAAAPAPAPQDTSHPTTSIDAKVIGAVNNPTKAILVRNMFDKDQETEPNWEEDIRLDFEEECSKYGKITKVVVMSKDPGGKIYALFETMEQAKTCASALAGRWFDKRQLRVEFVADDSVPSGGDGQ